MAIPEIQRKAMLALKFKANWSAEAIGAALGLHERTVYRILRLWKKAEAAKALAIEEEVQARVAKALPPEPPRAPPKARKPKAICPGCETEIIDGLCLCVPEAAPEAMPSAPEGPSPAAVARGKRVDDLDPLKPNIGRKA